MTNSNRPLSPHLSVYRWPITMTLSILHRASGVALSVGLIVLVLWLESAAFGGDAYRDFATFMQGGLGRLLLAGFSFAFFFHMANGVRHLFWDAGRGFEIRQANASAWLVLAFTIIATLAYWLTF
jgi:succinate dehydrogenase / fumarate reductase cytochrome b subunit